MNRKVFTILLLLVFTLTQFTLVSAAAPTGDGTLSAPTYSEGGATATVKIDWTASGMTAPTTYVDMYARPKGGTYVTTECRSVAVAVGSSAMAGSFVYDYLAAVPADQQVWEFLLVFDSVGSCLTPPADPAVAANYMASTLIDAEFPVGFQAAPPSLNATFAIDDDLVACNTFEMWALYSEQQANGLTWKTDAYSGLKSWNQQQTGAFAPSAPLGNANDLLSWKFTFPATAINKWSLSINPTDYAGNDTGAYNFRSALEPTSAELADCKSFTDTAGHEDEIYIRYLADLNLITGNPDGSYGPDSTLSRAEAAILFEKANGVKSTDPGFPTKAPSESCTFNDVAATDWFAGWVWQACADGFMSGVGDGKFDPTNLLTRAQVATIFNNIYLRDVSNGAYLDGPTSCGNYCTVLNTEWNAWAIGGSPELREQNWADAPVGSYYTNAIVHAYGVGIADGTSATTFSPDRAILRGEFAKMLYRALSRV